MADDIVRQEPIEAVAGRWIRLVPVEVFGLLCDEHEDLPKTVPRGLSDAVSSWSDCNRAEGHIYRVDEDWATREAGEAARVWVADADLPFFEKRWGEHNTGIDPVERVVSMDPPRATVRDLVAAAESRGRTAGYAEAVQALGSHDVQDAVALAICHLRLPWTRTVPKPVIDSEDYEAFMAEAAILLAAVSTAVAPSATTEEPGRG
jgi:hypothetical protein